MYVINRSMPLLLSIAVLLLSFNDVSALPTAEVAQVETRAPLHPCSVQVYRWCQDCDPRFDTYYWNVTWTTPWNWPITNFWDQESSIVNTPHVGSEFVPWPVGSNILHIWNTADPSPPGNYSDPGKLTMQWGNQHWDTFSPGNPCDVIPAKDYIVPGGATVYECHFMCDKGPGPGASP